MLKHLLNVKKVKAIVSELSGRDSRNIRGSDFESVWIIAASTQGNGRRPYEGDLVIEVFIDSLKADRARAKMAEVRVQVSVLTDTGPVLMDRKVKSIPDLIRTLHKAFCLAADKTRKLCEDQLRMAAIRFSKLAWKHTPRGVRYKTIGVHAFADSEPPTIEVTCAQHFNRTTGKWSASVFYLEDVYKGSYQCNGYWKPIKHRVHDLMRSREELNQMQLDRLEWMEGQGEAYVTLQHS